MLPLPVDTSGVRIIVEHFCNLPLLCTCILTVMKWLTPVDAYYAGGYKCRHTTIEHSRKFLQPGIVDTLASGHKLRQPVDTLGSGHYQKPKQTLLWVGASSGHNPWILFKRTQPVDTPASEHYQYSWIYFSGHLCLSAQAVETCKWQLLIGPRLTGYCQ